jgi:hypothetical protein
LIIFKFLIWFITPERILEKEDAQLKQTYANSDVTGNRVSTTDGGRNIRKARRGRNCVNVFIEPEQSRCAPARAHSVNLHGLHERKISLISAKGVVVGGCFHRSVQTLIHVFVCFLSSSGENNGLSAVCSSSSLAATVESEIASGK